jgi:hypothetical protein
MRPDRSARVGAAYSGSASASSPSTAGVGVGATFSPWGDAVPAENIASAATTAACAARALLGHRNGTESRRILPTMVITTRRIRASFVARFVAA